MRFIFILFVIGVGLGPQSANADDDYTTQILSYKECVNELVKQHVPWLAAFAACGNQGRADDARLCLDGMSAQAHELPAIVAAMACAGRGKAELAIACMAMLASESEQVFAPEITNGACASLNSVDEARTCMRTLMQPSSGNPEGYDNVMAGILCGGRSRAPQVATCFQNLNSTLAKLAANAEGLSSIEPIFGAQACTGGHTSVSAAQCLRQAVPQLETIGGVSHQATRAAGYACSRRR